RRSHFASLSVCLLFCSSYADPPVLHAFPTRRSSDLGRRAVRRPRKRVNRREEILRAATDAFAAQGFNNASLADIAAGLGVTPARSEEHTSELQSRENLVCRLLLEKKTTYIMHPITIK